MSATKTSTDIKSDAIFAAINTQNPQYMISRLTNMCYLLASLTSANQDEREVAKKEVRKLVQTGTQILKAEKAAQDLADFANRNEP